MVENYLHTAILKGNEPTHINIHFPGYGILGLTFENTPTWEEIKNNSFFKEDSRPKNNVEITAQSESKGAVYRCNFLTNTFEYIESAPSLSDEKHKREEFEKQYQKNLKSLKCKERSKLIMVAICILLTCFINYFGKELVNTKILFACTGFVTLSCLLTIVVNRIRFENSGGYYH